MKRLLSVSAFALGAAFCASSALADTLALWTFETSVPGGASGITGSDIGGLVAEEGVFAGTSIGSGHHASSATVWNNPAGNGSAESLSSNNWAVGDYLQFSTSTLGYSGITFQWDHTSSNTGPRDFDLSWSLDGTNFSSLGTTFSVLANAAPNPVWNSSTGSPLYTLGPVAAPADLDNQPVVYFRLSMATNISANGGTVASGGTSRVDNVMIVPEPGSLALLALSSLVFLRRR